MIIAEINILKTRSALTGLLVFIFFPFLLHAQLNESDTSQLQVRMSLSGNHQTGNVRLLSVRARAEAVVQLSGNLKFKTQNNSQYQTFGGQRADNDINSRNFLYFRPEKTVYPFAMSFIQRNLRRKVDLRYFAGTGITWQIVQIKDGFIKLSGSLVTEQTQFMSDKFNQEYYNGSRKINTWRATVYVNGGWKTANGRMGIFATAYWQAGLQKVSNHRTLVELGAELNIWKGLAMSVFYQSSFEQVVPEKIQQRDDLLTFGLNYHIILSKQ